jgi:hypothetical protein
MAQFTGLSDKQWQLLVVFPKNSCHLDHAKACPLVQNFCVKKFPSEII